MSKNHAKPPPAAPTAAEIHAANRALYDQLPAPLRQAIETALSIASTDLVNLEAGAAYLLAAAPEEFQTVQDAAAALESAAVTLA